MFSSEEIKIIAKALEKGNNIMIRQKDDEIQIMEEKAKVVRRFRKDRKLPQKAADTN